MARVLFLLCFLLVCPLLTHAASCEQAHILEEIQEVTKAKNLWIKTFGTHVEHNRRYQEFLNMMVLAHKNTSRSGINILCDYFSKLRYATCYAMALNPDRDSSVFLEALSQCHDSEIYQVFIAIDSYHRGQLTKGLTQSRARLYIMDSLQETGSWHSFL